MRLGCRRGWGGAEAGAWRARGECKRKTMRNTKEKLRGRQTSVKSVEISQTGEDVAKSDPHTLQMGSARGHSQGKRRRVHSKARPRMCAAAFRTADSRWGQLKRPSAAGWTQKLWAARTATGSLFSRETDHTAALAAPRGHRKGTATESSRHRGHRLPSPLMCPCRRHQATAAGERRGQGEGLAGWLLPEQGPFRGRGQCWGGHSWADMPMLADLWGLLKEDRAGA